MSKQCKAQEIPLRKLEASYLELTQKKGVLRVLQPGEDIETRAQGLWFYCPICKDAPHGVTILFEGVKEDLRPRGRYLVETVWPMDKLTVLAEVKPQDIPCKWKGYISGGKVKWKPNQLS